MFMYPASFVICSPVPAIIRGQTCSLHTYPASGSVSLQLGVCFLHHRLCALFLGYKRSSMSVSWNSYLFVFPEIFLRRYLENRLLFV